MLGVSKDIEHTFIQELEDRAYNVLPADLHAGFGGGKSYQRVCGTKISPYRGDIFFTLPISPTTLEKRTVLNTQ